jgi:hypothetical protein
LLLFLVAQVAQVQEPVEAVAKLVVQAVHVELVQMGIRM